MRKNRKPANQKIIKALQTGRNLTTEQLTRRANVYGVSQRISELRKNGYPNIYTNKIVRNGRLVYAYRLGKPTQEMFDDAANGDLQLNWQG